MGLLDSLLGGFIFLAKFRAVDQALQKLPRRFDFALHTHFSNGTEQSPDIIRSFKMIAPVAQNMYGMHQPQVLQLFNTVADIGACHAERFGNFLGIHRPAQDIEQGMDLRNGTVDPPFGAHFAPVEDKFFSGRIQFHSDGILFLSFISVNTEIKKFFVV